MPLKFDATQLIGAQRLLHVVAHMHPEVPELIESASDEPQPRAERFAEYQQAVADLLASLVRVAELQTAAHEAHEVNQPQVLHQVAQLLKVLA